MFLLKKKKKIIPKKNSNINPITNFTQIGRSIRRKSSPPPSPVKFNISITSRVNENLIAIGHGNGAMENVCVCVIPMGPPPFRIPSQPSNNPRSREMVSRTWFHAQESYPRFMPICQIFRDRIFLHTFTSLLTFEGTSERVKFEEEIRIDSKGNCIDVDRFCLD